MGFDRAQPAGSLLQAHHRRQDVPPVGDEELDAVRQNRDGHSHGGTGGRPRRSMIRPGIRRLFTLAFRRRGTWKREVEDEMMLHLTLRAEQLAAQGMAPVAARDEAIRRFGPLTESRAQLFDAARDREDQMRHTEFMDNLRQDVSFAFRARGGQKGWTTVAVTTLDLGNAATTAVWSAASTLLLHPLPFPDATRIVIVELQPTTGNHTGVQV